MSDDQPPMPDEDTVPPADPFEAELVAYLDGELDPAAARRVEARLAADPEARARAVALKQTFDLLDYLPRPEPSPDFTARTLDRLPAMKSGSVPAPEPRPRPGPAANPPRAPSPSGVSTSLPVPLTTGTVPLAAPPLAPPRRTLWVAGLLLAVCACAAAGYLGASAVSPHPPAARDTPPEDLPITDHRVVENLPLYAAADDLEFVHDLAKSDCFGDDPAVSFDSNLKPPPVEPDKPSGVAFEALARAFKALPPPRQQAIRELDKQLHALDPATRDRLFRVLEAYTLWLDRLPEPDRKEVLTAAHARDRLKEVRDLRDQQWFDSLPEAQRKKLTGLPPAQKAELIRQWKDEETDRRGEWAFVRRHAPDMVENKIPWPFDDPARRKEVIDFARVAFRLDERKPRLADPDLVRYNATLSQANAQGGWHWHAYGKLVYDWTQPPTRKFDFPKYEPQPEGIDGAPMVTEPKHLLPNKQAERFFTTNPGAKVAAQDKIGKWPDFALVVHSFPQLPKAGPLPQLGPAKPGEFKEPLRSFITKELLKELTPFERKALGDLEGRWPEYPRKVIELSRLNNLSAPGLMLPGSPRQWETMYGFGRGRP